MAGLASVMCLACSVGTNDPFPGSVTIGSAGSASGGSTGEIDASSSDAGDNDDAASGDSNDTSGADTSASDSTSANTSSADSIGTDDSSTDPTSTTSGAETSGDPLDPDLDIPNGGEQCTTPGDLNECPGIAVCRFATTEYGLCESCDACGNLNAACVEGTDCDILFSCYAGRCTNFCTLGTFECGPIEDCLDIGHATKGVCDPFA
jgi:hypothetical protein